MVGSRVRRAAAVLAAGVLAALLGGCQPAKSPGTGPPAGAPSATSKPVPTVGATAPPSRPAALAGGACLLLDFDVIKARLGTEFNVAAAADTSGTFSCVVQNAAASHPDMILSITATDLSIAEFTADAQPDGAKAVTKLGKVGYEIEDPAPSGAGPVIEVGWLSGNERLIVLRYTCATGTSAAAVDTLAGKMISLARTVDATTV